MRKKKLYQTIITLAILILLSACTNELAPGPTLGAIATSASHPDQAPIQKTQTQPTLTPTRPCQFVTHEINPHPDATTTTYFLDVSLDYDQHFLTISQRIDYTNRTGESLSELPLVVSSARDQGAFSLLSLQLMPAFSKTRVKVEDAKILLELDPALQPGDLLTIDLVFEIQPPQQRTAFGYTQRQMLLADWYPYIPPFLQGQGWIIHPPSTVGEHQVFPLSNVYVNLQLLPSEQDLVVAASAPVSAQREQCYQYSTSEVRNFSLAISPEYHLTSMTNTLGTVKIYTFPEHSGLGKRAADLALQAWETFTDIYGPNPRVFMSMVVAEIEDGLECDGLFYLSDWYLKTADDTPQNYFELLVVHETSHQWLYGLIHNDQALEPWLDESLATYSELLYYEKHYPHLVQWWWDFRVNAYSPSGNINATIYDFDSYRAYVNAVYLMGSRFIAALRQTIGETDFYSFLNAYAQMDTGDFRSSSDFFTILETVTSTEFSQIKREFFK